MTSKASTKNATRSRRGIDVVLWQADDWEKLDELLSAVRKASVDAANLSGARAGDVHPVVEATKAYDDFVEEALPRADTLRVVALRKNDWRELLKKHPPRRDVVADPVVDPETGESTPGEVLETFPRDRLNGFDTSTMDADLVPASVVDAFTTAAKRDAYLDELSDPEWSKIYSAAVRANQDGGPDPLVRLSSLTDRIFGPNSESPEASD